MDKISSKSETIHRSYKMFVRNIRFAKFCNDIPEFSVRRSNVLSERSKRRLTRFLVAEEVKLITMAGKLLKSKKCKEL